MHSKKRTILFLITLVSGIWTFVTLMVYMQSDYERYNCDKIIAIVVDVGEIEKEITKGRRSYVTKYYQDVWIEFENDGVKVDKYCERVSAANESGYEVGEEVTCYVDEMNNITFAYNVRDNLYGTIVAGIVFVVGVCCYIRAGKDCR